MREVIEFYFYLLILSGLISLNLSFYTWRRFWSKRKVDPARFFSIILLAVFIWALGSALAVIGSNQSLIYFWEQFKYIGILIIPPSWAILALQWTGRSAWMTPQRIISLYIIPSFILILIFTDPIHHLIWERIDYQSFGPYTLTVTTHGIAWWAMWMYSYVMIAIGMLYLLNGFLNTRYIYKKQALILLIGSFFPWFVNAIYAFNIGPLAIVDFTPTAFIVTGVAYAWGFSRLKLIDIPPFAKHAVFEYLDDSVFVFDANYRLLEINPCAEQLFQLKGKELIGKDERTVFADHPSLTGLVNQPDKGPWEFCYECDGKERVFDVHRACLSDRQGQCSGYLLSLRDITERKQMENAIQESEKKFRTYTESASVAIMIYQNDKWVYANPAAERITGYIKEELLTMYFWDFVHPDYIDLIMKRGRARQRGENPLNQYEFKIISKQRKEKWVDLRAERISYNKKNAVLITAIDITDRKEAEVTVQKQLVAITSSIDGIAILNPDERYTYLNQAHATIYGYEKPEDLIGKTWTALYGEKELQRFEQEIMPKFQEEGRWRGEAIGLKKDGMSFDQEITLTSLSDGGLICVVRDITKQKMVVNELQDAHELLYTINKDLERKVKERTKQIEQLIKQKDDFINQLGHDLKTPLTPMMVLLPLLKEKVSSEKDNELFDVVIRNVFFMKDLVNKTVDLAKLNSDKIEFAMEPVNLFDLTELLVKNNQVLFEKHHIHCINEIQHPFMVHADPLRLSEVFNNLITNAIKYSSKEGGTIILSADEDETMVTVSIQDTGIGMSEQEIKNIFDEFYKADESRHDLDSSGLGLTITKKIIEKHGGTIWAESEGKEKGSTFFFTLPKEQTHAKKTLPVENAKEPGEKLVL
jgi:PAS domain S-box-containing protein